MKKPGRKSFYSMMITLGIAMIPQLVRMPPAVVILTLMPFLWRFAAEARNWKPLHRIIRYAAISLSLLSLFMSYGNLLGRRSAVSMLTMMLTLKLLEAYSIRDARMIISFCFFLCATQFLFQQGIIMPVYGGAVIVSALIALTHLHRNEAFQHAGSTPDVAHTAFSELRFSLKLMAIAIPIGLMLFMFFPRWANPLWGVPETTLDAKTGLSDSMSPGSIENLFMDDSAAFRVEFESSIPPPSQMYWRGPVFWDFDGRTWRRGFMGSNIRAERRPEARTAPWKYTVQIEPNERKWLYALEYPATVPANSRLTMDFQILSQRPLTQLREYSMVSDPDFIDTPVLKQELRMQALDLPEGYNPRSAVLAQQFRSETTKDRELIRKLLTYFNEEPFHYSLQAPLLGRDSIDDFLFETRRGYCEHYASAFTVLMRMAGIPARVVTGYQGGWYNELGDYLLIKQSDAHAWAEVWLEGEGWTRVDPTAAVSPLRVEQGSLGALSEPRHMLDFNWLRKMRNGVDIVQQRWNDWVIEFDAKRQSQLLSPLGIKNMGTRGLVVVMIISIGILIAILTPFILRLKGPQNKDPLQKLWMKFLNRLDKAGFKSRPSLGPVELGRAAALKIPESETGITRITDLYARIRYSSRPPEIEELKVALSEFKLEKSRNA
jgi:transglutaminase-like putative cysteine protease